MPTNNTTLVFTATHTLIVELRTPTTPQQYTGYSARQLSQLYRAASDTTERQLIADALCVLHVVRGDRLLGWLAEEQTYQELVSRNVPYLAQDHRTWLSHIQAQVETEIAALDHDHDYGEVTP